MKKITTGFVIQTYKDDGGGLLKCTEQEFVAGDPVEWEDDEGNPIDIPLHDYQPFSMVQPDSE